MDSFLKERAYAAAVFTSILISIVNQVQSDLGSSHWVNLEEVAEKYIQKINQSVAGCVDTWGLTGDYFYWKHSPDPGKHPVKADVDSRGYRRLH
ncbi:hypothetical protein MTO96_008976 [Rhipicephalus appendiculatus]